MDVNAVTAALQDLLGPDVTQQQGASAPWWEWHGFGIEVTSAVTLVVDRVYISAADLDKLHAASQIVRRMVTP